MVTKSNTNIFVKLDVWTTYMFNYKVLPSFVDRCHVPRWNGDIPTYNLEDEGLEKGEIIQIAEAEEIRHVSDYDDCYIASREESQRQVAVAEEFLQMAEQYCMAHI